MLTDGVVIAYGVIAVVHPIVQVAFAFALTCSVVPLVAVIEKRSPGPGVEGFVVMTVSPEALCGATVSACATGLNKRAMKTPDSNLMHLRRLQKAGQKGFTRQLRKGHGVSERLVRKGGLEPPRL